MIQYCQRFLVTSKFYYPGQNKTNNNNNNNHIFSYQQPQHQQQVSSHPNKTTTTKLSVVSSSAASSASPPRIFSFRITFLSSFQRNRVGALGFILGNLFLHCCFRTNPITSVRALSTTPKRIYTTISSSNTMPQQQQQQNKKDHIIFHWFRQGDLRLHDNPALIHSVKLKTQHEQQQNGSNCFIVPIYCFDNVHLFGTDITHSTPTTKFVTGTKCGVKRAQFIQECIGNLQSNLREQCDVNLVIGLGEPSIVFTKIVRELYNMMYSDNSNNTSTTAPLLDISIVYQDEVVKEEQDIVKAVHQSVQDVLRECNGSTANATTTKSKSTVKLHPIWGSTMYELTDLPYKQKLTDLPDVFTPFRNKVEKNCIIRRPLPTPTKTELGTSSSSKNKNEYQKIQEHLQQSYGMVPSLEQLGYKSIDELEYARSNDQRGVLHFKGGETAALQRMKEYIWEKDCLKDYFDTRNALIGPNYSTKLSPWLAHGCISPRTIAMNCQKYEKERIQNKSTYWVVFELLWRDYCKFFALKHGNTIFYLHGTVGKNVNRDQKKWGTYEPHILAWQNGLTGYPFVDANMRELISTGFMSNRGRQNVASFLAIDLYQDWRIGGEYFESTLLDYDVYSNWVNWCSAAGMTGGRLNRFNIVKQSKDYDQHGDYLRLWLPELKNVPTEYIHEPWKLTTFQQMEYQMKLGVDYPYPIVPPGGNPPRSNDGSSGGNRGGDRNQPTPKQRKPNQNQNNKGQKYEMKSVKTGGYKLY